MPPSTAAYRSNRDFVGEGRSDHRPLSVIAAAAGGGVPQARIRRVLADLVEAVSQIHASGRVHGAIAMHTVGLDSAGKAHLLAPPLLPAADAETAVRIEGYAAFEQYTDDPDHPCGPWTDIYGLCAVAHTMIVGAAPPAALARCVRDDYQPLAGRDVGAYDEGFLRAVDRGLSLNGHARMDTLASFADAFQLIGAQPAPPPTPPEPAPAAPMPVTEPPARARVSRLTLLLVLAAAALALYLWLRPADPDSAGQVAQSGRTAATPQPDTPSTPLAVPAPDGAPADPGAATGSPALADSDRAAGADVAPAAGAGPNAAGAPAAAPEPPLLNPNPAPAGPSVASPQAAALSSESAVAAPADQPDEPGADGAASTPETPGVSPPEAAVAAVVPVRIHVRPWGQVLVDGQSRGVSPPLRELRLAPGRHRVTVRNPAAPDYSITLNVQAGEPAAISHVFD